LTTIGGGGKERVIAHLRELLWQPEREEEEGGWSRKSVVARRWLPTGQTGGRFVNF
jgi:hypothetical protein